MICPNCKYEHGWNGATQINGKHDDFFKLPVTLERISDIKWGYDNDRSVYGCPKCLNLFMTKD